MTGPATPRLHFLRQSADIDRVKKQGRRRQTSLFTVLAYRSGMPVARVGIIVGKRFGPAVARNRAKRIFRELARQSGARLVAGQDLLVFPRREALTVRHAVLKESWMATLAREGLFTTSDKEPCEPSASG
ncbi:ribonuclease P protein component [Candidatus Nitrospira bockiana]